MSADKERNACRHWVRLAVLLAAIAGTAGGCVKDEILERARTLSDEIGVYRQKQADRVERLNKEYQATFSDNLAELTRLSDVELTQARDVDAQLLADQITEADKATYFGALRGRLSSGVAGQRKSIDAADQAIAAARDKYLASYKEAKLQLNKLTQLQSELAVLAQREDAMRVAGRVIQKVVENYRQIREEQKAEQEGDSSGT